MQTQATTQQSLHSNKMEPPVDAAAAHVAHDGVVDPEPLLAEYDVRQLRDFFAD